MERIRLSKVEKKTLRSLSLGYVYPPDGVSRAAWLSAIRSLQRIGFVKGAFVEGGDVESVRMTNDGRAYIEQNPHLYNPIEWSKISAIVGIITGTIMAVAAIVAILVACSMR